MQIGGTIGDIESLPFIEAIRQFHNDNGHSNFVIYARYLVPFIASSGELKTKPTQHSVKELRSLEFNQTFYYVGRIGKYQKEKEKKLVCFVT